MAYSTAAFSQGASSHARALATYPNLPLAAAAEGGSPSEDDSDSDDSDQEVGSDDAESLVGPDHADVKSASGSEPSSSGASEAEDGGAEAGAQDAAGAAAEEDRDLPALTGQSQYSAFLREYKSASAKRKRIMLDQLASGEITPFGEEQARAEEVARQEWLATFETQVIDIRGVSKGMRTGGIRRFSALVVAGNHMGVIGLGTGKSAELAAAVSKANMRALKNLFCVPRYKGHTIYQTRIAKFGRNKVIMYPKATGSGIVASPMISAICRLAGIQDIGVKVHGSRNSANTVKALIMAFESQVTPEEVAREQQVQEDQASSNGPDLPARGQMQRARLMRALRSAEDDQSVQQQQQQTASS